MTKKHRWILAIADEASKTEVQMPWARGARRIALSKRLRGYEATIPPLTANG